MTDAQSNLIQALLNNQLVMGAVLAAVSTFFAAVSGLVVSTWRKVRGQATADQLAILDKLAATAVQWVEQTTVPGTASAEKLDKAVAFVIAQAQARGIPANEQLVHALVEAAVLGLTNPAPVQ